MILRVTRLARSDVDGIHDYIADDNPTAAVRWVQRTRERFEFLAKNPGVGEARDEIRLGIRSFSHGSYVIFFRIKNDTLEVVRVVHGSRDIRFLL